MTDGKIFVNQSLTLNFTIRDQNSNIVNVSAALPTIQLQRVGGSIISGTTTYVTNGADGKVIYVIAANVLTLPGVWEVQLTYSENGDILPANKVTFEVLPRI